MTQVFVPSARRLPPAATCEDIVVEEPPDSTSSAPSSLLSRVLPIGLSVASMGVMAAAFASGSAATRNPMFLAFPMMMLASTVVTAVTGRARRQGGGVDAGRTEYLEYLSRLRGRVSEIAVTQRCSLDWSHPDPDTLWTLIGGPRMWERQAADHDFCLVRVGIGTVPLASRLVAPPIASGEASDPVIAAALRRFIHTHSTIVAPITTAVCGSPSMTIDGEVTLTRALLRAMICQLAVWHPPDQVLIAAAIGDRHREHWDWLKWLPHNQHPNATDEAGQVRMVYPSAAEARRALADMRPTHVVVIADLDERPGEIPGATIIEVGTDHPGAPLQITRSGESQPVLCPDEMDPTDALICARRLAMYRASAAARRHGDPDWSDLTGLGDVNQFDPITLWRRQGHRDRLRVPIGTTVDGAALDLDIKEPAENGAGPHGLCVGATGSGKSELLRTIALGMMVRNPPEVLNLLLVDFKGGATFNDYAQAPHVAAVITNLADDAPLVARMRDALAGEMNRRQQLLRAAGCVGVAVYEGARRAGAPLAALPTLFVIVDEFSELLSQHPDFVDMFAAIGRLGRSLGMHLLLASQRLDEGRLRGLEAHLSYRICLRTLSPGESRAVLGTLDAYQLPSAPGAGFLCASGGEPIRFQAAMVSGPPQSGPPRVPAVAAQSMRVFSTRMAGSVSRAGEVSGAPAGTILRSVLERLSGYGPRAHQVWLPPLGPAPALHTLLRDVVPTAAGLTVPIGMVDRPFEQCRTPLMVDLSGAAGNVAVVGAPQSGKSTALCTLITALAAAHDPGRVQFYCLDFGGGALTSALTLPHVGAVAGRADRRLVERIVAECESVVRSREAIFSQHGIASIAQYRQQRAVADDHRFGDPFGDVFLVVDGWASVRQEYEALEDSITALGAQGLSFGVHVMLSASRWAEVRPSLRDQIGTRIELRLGDPADSELDRKAAQHVPHDRPGRGLTRDGLHMVIASPVAEVPRGESVAPAIPLLPNHVDHHTVVESCGAALGSRILLGLEERRLQPTAVDFERHSHLLVLGDNECGKTATLRTLCREIVRTKHAAQAQLLIVDFRRSLRAVVPPEHLRGYAMSPAALGALLPDLLDLLRRRMPPLDASQAQLQARSWWSGPDLYVVVDDYDLVATPSGNVLAPIVEFLPYARDLGVHLVVARRSGGAERALFEPLLASLRDHGCMTLLMSGGAAEAAAFGSRAPMRLPAGRGVLTTRAGDEQLVQVAWSTP
jgi:DNA segregation ATPase FtsK/SpoIIIE, S-DNA-T family